MLDSGCRVQIRAEQAVVVSFLEEGIQCHYVAGVGLAGMITNAPPRLRAKFLAAAVLAFQRQMGVRHETPAGRTPAEKPTGPGWRQHEVLTTIRSSLIDCLCIGLSHLSQTMQLRLDTLAVSAHGADMPRLAALLRSLAEEVELLLDRNAQADEGQLLMMICQTFALTEAVLEAVSPSPSLLGRYQSQYEDFDNLELVGAAAWPWRTKSGYDGLTLLLWQQQEQCWYTWSDSRPDHITGANFNLAERYRQPISWQNGLSPERLSRSGFALAKGRRNGHHRLSSSAQCQLSLLGEAAPRTIDFHSRLFVDWSALSGQAAKAFPVGLEQGDPLERFVVLKPARWGQKKYDEISQAFRWPIFDSRGRQTDIALPYDEVSAHAIDCLQQIQPRWHSVWAVVGRIVFEQAGFAVQPYTLYGKPPMQGERTWNIHFDTPVSRPGKLLARILGGNMKSVVGMQTR